MIAPRAPSRSVALLALALSLPTAAASAHAFLERASPPVGSSVPTSPAVLDLFFTEPVVARFSSVRVLNDKNQPISTGSLRLAADNNRELQVPLPKLSMGTYTVLWRVTSQDTHRTQGRFTFKVEI